MTGCQRQIVGEEVANPVYILVAVGLSSCIYSYGLLFCSPRRVRVRPKTVDEDDARNVSGNLYSQLLSIAYSIPSARTGMSFPVAETSPKPDFGL